MKNRTSVRLLALVLGLAIFGNFGMGYGISATATDSFLNLGSDKFFKDIFSDLGSISTIIVAIIGGAATIIVAYLKIRDRRKRKIKANRIKAIQSYRPILSQFTE